MSDAAPISVLHVDSAKTWRGGQVQVFELMRGLRDRDIAQGLACSPGSPLERRARDEGFDVHPIPMRGEWDLRAPARIAACVREIGAALLHAHASRAHGLCWRAMRRLPEVRLAVTRRVDFEISRNWLSRKKYTDSKTRYIAISRGIAEVLARGGVPSERVAVVHSGINSERFSGQYGRQDLLDEFHLEPGAFLIGNIAALTDHKGQCYLIEAASRVLESHPEARFFIVGEGELRSALERQIAERGLRDRVFLTGFRDDVEKFLAGIDLFVLSSHLEGLCTSLLDALHFGKPAVAARVGGVPDIIEHERNGLLAEPKNPDALAGAIGRMIQDSALRERCGAEGRVTVERKFTAQKMAEGTVEVYRKILSAV